MAVTQYIGARYVPVFADPMEWSNAKQYEPLSIVLHQGNSFTSKQFVPVGVDIDDTDYWAETGNYNAQVEAYRQEVLRFSDSIQEKAFAFDTVADMQESTQVYVGAISHTNGFHTSGDGGASFYKIGTNGTPNGMDVLALQNGLVATLVITEPYVTPEMFGAWGDYTHDDSSYFYRMLEYVALLNQLNETTYKPLTITLINGYNIGTLEAPDAYFNYLKITGGQLYGQLKFVSTRNFNTIKFENTLFFNEDGYALILTPNKTLDFKTISFYDCVFRSHNGVNIDTRSVVVSFNNCTFNKCDIAVNMTDMDMAVFNHCWISTADEKTESAYTIIVSGTNESSLALNDCIVVNSTDSMGVFDKLGIVSTKGIFSTKHTRYSNEGGTDCALVVYHEDTPESISGHMTSAIIDTCDVQLKSIVHLKGLPSSIFITSSNGLSSSKMITMDDSILHPEDVRPGMIIGLNPNAFTIDSIASKYGYSGNSYGINCPESIRNTIPFSLRYAIRFNTNLNMPLILRKKDGYAIDERLSGSEEIFTLFIKGSDPYFKFSGNSLVFLVRYTYRVPNTQNRIACLDAIYVTYESNTITIKKYNVFGNNADIGYSIVDNGNNKYTVSMNLASQYMITRLSVNYLDLEDIL